MLKNYLKIAHRTLRRNRGFALLNVGGLALGMACVILIALYVQDERSFDAFHERADRIVRLDVDFVQDGEVNPSGNTQGILAPTLAAAMPEVEAAIRLTQADPVLRARGEAFEAEQLLLADPEIFDVFTFPLRSGDAKTALEKPGSIVLTETFAATLFGDTPAQGHTVAWKDEVLTVTGVMANVPRPSHLQFDGLISLSTTEDPGWFYENWFAIGFTTYALLGDGADLDAFRAKLPGFLEAAAGDAMREEGTDLVLHARPLETLYLTAERGMGTFGSGATLRILVLVAFFVLLVAGVNFTNLATARSLDRAREVGVRKSLGAQRGGLAVQFLAEAVVLSLVATALAVVLARLALPAFQQLSSKPLSLLDLGMGWIGILALAGLTGLCAGAYPAFVLSGFRPTEVLKGRFSSGQRGQALRQGLVVVQFGIAVALIAATAIVFSQLRHMQSQDLGLDLGGDATQLLVLPFMGDSVVVKQLPGIQARLRGTPGVQGVTASLIAPTFGTYSAGGTIETPDGRPGREMSATMYLADSAYARVYGLDVVAGRTGTATAPGAPREYVLSETAVRKAGYASPEAILGKPAQFWGMEGEVVGVIRDVHVEGLQRAAGPLVLTAGDEDVIPPNVLTLRVSTAHLSKTLTRVEALWGDLVPSRPFTYTFLDEDFAEEYRAEQRFGRLFGVFAVLAIVIACLGLFGLATYTAQQRRKEIGVRKVLGASVTSIVALLSKDFVKLVGLAFVVAAPLAYVAMQRWLEGFAYRIELGLGVFLLAGAAALGIALLTVSYQAFKAARTNPTEALRAE